MADQTQSSGGGGFDVGVVTGVAQAATGIAQTIANIIDQGKRRQFEQQVALLSNAQQVELNNKLLAANSQTERLQILSNAVLQYTIQAQGSQDKQKTTMIIVASALGGLLVIIALVYSLKHKTA